MTQLSLPFDELDADWSQYWLQFESQDTPASTHIHLDTLTCIRSDDRVLDIGCGYGRSTRALLSAAANVVGVDINLAEVTNAYRQFPRVSGFAVMNGANLALASGVFDHVTMFGVLGGVHLGMRRALVREALRVLKPGGVLHISEHTVDHAEPNKRALYEHGRQLTGEPGTLVVRHGSDNAVAFVSKQFEPIELEDLLFDAGAAFVKTKLLVVDKPDLRDPTIVYQREVICAWATKI